MNYLLKYVIPTFRTTYIIKGESG